MSPSSSSRAGDRQREAKYTFTSPHPAPLHRYGERTIADVKVVILDYMKNRKLPAKE